MMLEGRWNERGKGVAGVSDEGGTMKGIKGGARGMRGITRRERDKERREGQEDERWVRWREMVGSSGQKEQGDLGQWVGAECCCRVNVLETLGHYNVFVVLIPILGLKVVGVISNTFI
jgi:hypothetical protein